MKYQLLALLFCLGIGAANGQGLTPSPGVPIGGPVSTNTITANESGAVPVINANRAAWIINVRDLGALGNALAFSTGVTVIANSPTLVCSGCSFSAKDIGKAVAINGVGTGGGFFTATISSITNGTTVVLSTSPAVASGNSYLSQVSVATNGNGSTSYIPGNTVTLAGGTNTTPSVITVTTTEVSTAIVNAAGSGGTNGACVLIGTTGTGNVFRLNATVTSGAISALGTYAYKGNYTVNPTSLSAEPVTGCGLTGATLTLNMGIATATITTPGVYSGAPSSPASQASSSGSGVGATFNVSYQSNGQLTYGTDDSAALAQALTNCNGNNTSTRLEIYLPGGNYYVKSTSLPTQTLGCAIVGDGTNQTFVTIDPTYTGAIFSWSRVWIAGPGPVPGQYKQGPQMRGITVVGQQTTNEQDAIVFYDRNDFALLYDVDVMYLNGACLSMGARTLNEGSAYLRESKFYQVHCWNDGTASVPAVEVSTIASAGDGSNEIRFFGLDIFAATGVGLAIHTPSSGTAGTRLVKGFGVRVENPGQDNIDIGLPTDTGTTQNIEFYGSEIITPSVNHYGIRVSDNAPSVHIYAVKFSGGEIGPGSGGGINVVSGSGLYFQFEGMVTSQTEVTVGPSASGSGGNIIFDGLGSETSWTQSIDSSEATNVLFPARTASNNGAIPYSGGGSMSPGGGGNTVTGFGASASAGRLNSVNCTGCSINGGDYSTLTGNYSTASGTRVTDNGRSGGLYYSSGCQPYAIYGACQRGAFTLGVTTNGASAVRLTSTTTAANSSNCINILPGTAYKTRIAVSAHDRSASTTFAGWDSTEGLLYRGSGNAAFAGGDITATTPSESVGTLSTATITLSADTTNQCLNITFTPPAGNTDTLDVTATVDTAEVQ